MSVPSPVRRDRPAARAYCAALVIGFLPAPLFGQQPSPLPGVLAVENWGVFTATVTKRILAPGTSSGATEVPGQLTQLQQTTEICASIGTLFGFHFRLTRSEAIAEMPLIIRVEHPLFATWNGGRSAVDTYPTAIYPGESHWTGWAFRDPTKLVDGEWRFNVLAQGRLLLTETFNVRVACSVPTS